MQSEVAGIGNALLDVLVDLAQRQRLFGGDLRGHVLHRSGQLEPKPAFVALQDARHPLLVPNALARLQAS